jgi:UDP-N-acetylmuramate dehydrogenase
MDKSQTLTKSLEKLKENFILLSDEPMKLHTSMQVGGPADLFALPETQKELINLFVKAQKTKIPLEIIGDGTNLLVKDSGIRGLVISTKKLNNKINIEKITSKGIIVHCSSGTKLSKLCNFALDNSLKGLEFAAGIPGTLGGAVFMNAGIPDGSISDVIDSITIITNSGEIKTLNKNNLNFSYRKLSLCNSRFNGIILGVNLVLQKGDSQEIKRQFHKNLNNKKLSQPLTEKSAGCIFKNPDNKEPAGKLIDMAGLKGKQIGDARVSDLHANFIVNAGNSKCTDVLTLINYLVSKISHSYSVELETEIIIKGDDK